MKPSYKFLQKNIMALICFLITMTLLSGCTNVSNNKIERYQIGSWEADIGYTQIVKHGNLFYFSGVACGGETDEIALKNCYQTIDDLLKKMQLTREKIIQETIYALDIESLKQQIAVRKVWYGEKYPVSSWYQIDRLFDKSHRFEIQLIVSQ
jgi:2-iminobutanoate/2-iminopropanoate deaminase